MRGLYGGYALFIGALWAGDRVRDGGDRLALVACLVAAVLGLVMVVVGFFALMARTVVNLPNLPARLLDERQLRVRNEAFRAAYYVVVAGMLALIGAFLAQLFVTGSGSVSFTDGTVQAIWWGFFILTTTLPTAIIAWNEPDPDEE